MNTLHHYHTVFMTLYVFDFAIRVTFVQPLLLGAHLSYAKLVFMQAVVKGTFSL